MNFVGHFERRFDYRVRVLHTDGGGDYVNLDLFANALAYPAKEPKPTTLSQMEKSNKYTEQFWATCMIFNYRLPMHFWDDAK